MSKARERLLQLGRPNAIKITAAVQVEVAFNQLSGMNSIIYYELWVFELADLDVSSSLLSSARISIVNLVSTILGIHLIGKAGRKIFISLGWIDSSFRCLSRYESLIQFREA